MAALAAGRHILLEGPPGTGKSTLLRAVADELGIGFEFVEGNAELTPARLVGHFDPARVLAEGYAADVFVDGPLVAALRDGSLLYVEEINRIPEETLNVLITVMSEGELHVPRLGRVVAAPGLPAGGGHEPVRRRRHGPHLRRRCTTACAGWRWTTRAPPTRRPSSPRDGGRGRRRRSVVADGVVELVRRTRAHPDLRIGSSVRGAIDTVVVAARLAALRGGRPSDRRVGLDAALVALSGRVGSGRAPGARAEDIITELWQAVFGSRHGGAGKARRPGGGDRDLADQLIKEGAAADDGRRRGRAGARRRGGSWPATSTSTRSRRRSASSTRRRFARPSPRTPTRRWRCWPTSPAPPTSACGTWPGAWPGGSSSTLARTRAGPAAGRRHGAIACRTGPTAGDLDLDASLEALAVARAGGGVPDPRASSGCGRGRSRGRRCACWSTAAGRWAATRWPPRRWRRRRSPCRAPTDYSVVAFGDDVVVAKAQDAVPAGRARWSTTCSPCGASARPTWRCALRAARRPARAVAGRPARSPCCCRTAGRPCRATSLGAAAALDELWIVAPEADSDEAEALAAAVGAPLVTVAGPSSVPDAFARLTDR